MMTKEERDKRDLILERLNACAKMELQEPKKITVEELDDLTQKIVEQALTIEALKEQNRDAMKEVKDNDWCCWAERKES